MPEFFLDSANIDDILWAAKESGFVVGITVNQSLLAKEPPVALLDHIERIYDIAGSYDLDLSIPLTAADPDEMLQQGMDFAERFTGNNVAFKVPVSTATLPVISALALGGVEVNATCVFTGLQAAVAVEAGAQILSVFCGRINDEVPGFGWKVLAAARRVAGTAKVLAGSIRDKEMVGNAVELAPHIITMPRKLLETLADDPGSARSIAKFNGDFEAWKL